MLAIELRCSHRICGACSPPAAAQDTWPSARPIRMMVGFGAGGGTDVATRIVAEPLGRGARPAHRGREQARRRRHHRRRSSSRRAPKDGYNALMISTGHTVSAAMIKSQAYDAVKDFAPVGHLRTTLGHRR